MFWVEKFPKIVNGVRDDYSGTESTMICDMSMHISVFTQEVF